MMRCPVHLNTQRLDEEVFTAMSPYRPEAPTQIGWRSIGAHTVLIRQQHEFFGFRLWIADERGYYARTVTGPITHVSEEAAVEAARQYLHDNNLEADV
jgi:hypothetical protein